MRLHGVGHGEEILRRDVCLEVGRPVRHRVAIQQRLNGSTPTHNVGFEARAALLRKTHNLRLSAIIGRVRDQTRTVDLKRIFPTTTGQDRSDHYGENPAENTIGIRHATRKTG